jgi:hypothetical protein
MITATELDIALLMGLEATNEPSRHETVVVKPVAKAIGNHPIQATPWPGSNRGWGPITMKIADECFWDKV